jgi:hypothetical protein
MWGEGVPLIPFIHLFTRVLLVRLPVCTHVCVCVVACQVLVEQCQQIKAVDPTTKCFVYRNTGETPREPHGHERTFVKGRGGPPAVVRVVLVCVCVGGG